MHEKIAQYSKEWSQCGYSNGLPDEVPDELMHENLAPSYKAIAIAILRNDHTLQSLGFTPKVSPWYGALKRVEIAERNNMIQEALL